MVSGNTPRLAVLTGADNTQPANGPGGPNSGSGDDSRAREGYHDPTAGIADAAPARSALTLRLVLAAFAFIVCSIGAALVVTMVNAPELAAVLAFLAAVAVADIIVVTRRKLRGEPG